MVPPKTTAPDAGPDETWVPPTMPPADNARAVEHEQWLRQAADDLTRQMVNAAGDIAAVSPTLGLVVAARAPSASRGLVSLTRLIPGGTTGIAGARIARDAFSVAMFLVSSGVAALVDMGRVDPGGRLAQRTKVTDAYLTVQQQLEHQRAQLAAAAAPTTAAWGVYGQPAQPAQVPQDAAAAYVAQQQAWAMMQAQAAAQQAAGPPRTAFPRW